ncbi:protein-methionine sulfoxide oxidase mical2b isoform X2 [Conger conger]|uniref:protein-methionine sulfoxide oxidase mical2b isoform X2 n=1 Tax=Conger conger TaxID=82655 RepID=UPI002A5A96FA|nr:protein-methionine sulfoxide oxidase mical2b isoform X2 [Conger conger]
MAAVKALQQWCKIQCDGYRDVAITNMTTSFRDGLAFCALIHKYRPDLIDFDTLSKENVYENNNLAFHVAEDQLGIPALLDAEDMVALRVPDRLSILTYVSQYYNYFHGRSPIGGMAGIKRPADAPTDEPSGKKNLPVTAKAFPSKPATEIRPAPNTVTTPFKPSPKQTRAANEKKVLVESSNKTGTLSSSCTACKHHVHLVQRHLVDGKLYHRNCFKCSECSNILLSGTYKPGSEPGTFICITHQNTPGSGLSHRNGPAAPRVGPTWLVNKNDRTETPRPNSALSTPVVTSHAATKPNITVSTPKVSTPIATKTQEARKKFFETTPAAPADPPSNRSQPTTNESAGKGRVLLKVADYKDKDKDKAKALITKKLAEENSNNNNTTYHSGLRPTDGKFGNKPSPAEPPSWKKGQDNPGVRGLKPVEPSLPQNTPKSTTGPLWVKTTDKESTRPPSTFSSNLKDSDSSESPSDWRSKLKPVSKAPKASEPPFSTEAKRAEAPPKPSPTNLVPSFPPRPASSPSSAPLAVPSLPPRPASPASPGPSLPPRPTSPASSAPLAVPASQRAPSPQPARAGAGSWGFQNGKGSSSTNAPQPEVKSPKTKPDYIPKEEIMKELDEIENSLNELEKTGIQLEKQLRRSEEEGAEDNSMDELMVDWFNLIRSKQIYMRRESELVYIAKTQDLEEQQPGVEEELRRLMEKPERFKTAADKRREAELMEKLVEIVNDRNAIVEGLDEDRLREEEEDQQMNQLMQDLDIKKQKKKSAMKKLFGRKT